jgi:hypothetical protein
MQEKTVHLRNKYSKEEVYTKDYDNVEMTNGDVKFIRVYTHHEHPRTYLANRDAFEIVPKKSSP